jgi:hypothetical protein
LDTFPRRLPFTFAKPLSEFEQSFPGTGAGAKMGQSVTGGLGGETEDRTIRCGSGWQGGGLAR